MMQCQFHYVFPPVIYLKLCQRGAGRKGRGLKVRRTRAKAADNTQLEVNHVDR